jgi:hypothetical protein
VVCERSVCRVAPLAILGRTALLGGSSIVGAALENFITKKCFQTVFFVSTMLWV